MELHYQGYNEDVQQPTWWQSLFEAVDISRHLKGAPGGPSEPNRDPLPPFNSEHECKHDQIKDCDQDDKFRDKL